MAGGTAQSVIDAPGASSTLLNGAWHYIGFSYDGNGNATITVDGLTVATQSGVQLAPVTPARVWLGRDMAGNFFRGGIDNTQVRRDALTQAGFQSIYASSIFSTVETIPGSNFTATSGSWAITGGSNAKNTDRRGSISYTFSVPSEGVWGFQVAAQPVGAVSNLQVTIPLDVLVDGVWLGSYNLVSFNGAVCNITGLTQDLLSGTHTLQIVNWNASGVVSLQINSVTILQPPGGAQGQSGWIAQELQDADNVNPVPASSYVSPLCMEGNARFPDQTVITSGTATTGVLSEVNGQWYANAPLNADGSETAVVASFEGGLVTSTNSVTWSALNVLAFSGSSMAIRLGDSLRLTSYPVGSQAAGAVSITIATGTNVVFSGTTTADVPLVYAFTASGAYSVQATSDSAPQAAMTVQVKSASFGDPLFAYVNNAQDWPTPNVGPDLSVEWDANLSVTGATPPPASGCDFQVLPLASGTLYGVARLSPGGPILARAEVDAYNIYDATQTGDAHQISTNPDGSKVVQCSIVINALPPGGYAVVQIYVAGASFEDGSTTMTLTAANFVNGVATFNINWANPDSVCHHVFIYNAQGNLVGAMW